MSETENGRLGLYGTKHSKCNHLMTLGFKGLTLLAGNCTIGAPSEPGFVELPHKRNICTDYQRPRIKVGKMCRKYNTHIYMNSTTTIIFKPSANWIYRLCRGYVWNKIKIISVFSFTCNHVWNWNKIISAAEGALKLFQRQCMNMLENIFRSCNKPAK